MTIPTDAGHSANRGLQAGRFIVQMPGMKISGLAAHQVVAMRKTTDEKESDVFVIHRITPEGHIEMSRIAPERLDEEACILETFQDVRAARERFERLRDHAKSRLPPCRIQLQFCRIPEWTRPCVVALLCPTLCQTGVIAWLSASTKDVRAEGAEIQAERRALNDYRAASRQILEESELPTWELEG
jgi:hypothetical protein